MGRTGEIAATGIQNSTGGDAIDAPESSVRKIANGTHGATDRTGHHDQKERRRFLPDVAKPVNDVRRSSATTSASQNTRSRPGR